MASGPVIALIDGEHHPTAVRQELERIEGERGLAGVGFCGGDEKLPDGRLEEVYGRAVEIGAEGALHRLASGATAVVDLADEPALPASVRLRLIAVALHLGLRYEAPGLVLEAPHYAPLDFAGPRLAVIGTGKRTGKTAVAGHWARLLDQRGLDPVLVCMSRGGPTEPRLVEPDTTIADLEAIVAIGGHGASDHLEGAMLHGVRAVGCHRVGGGPSGQPAESNVLAGAELAASLRPGAIVLEGSGACIPPVEADRTVCLAGANADEPFADLRLLRADLVLAIEGAPVDGFRIALRSETVVDPPADARVALFTTRSESCEGVDPVVASVSLSDRGRLSADLDRAAAEGCDLYLTELKGAAIDMVVARARERGAAVGFVRNRPVGIDGDLDAELMSLAGDG